MHLQLTLVMELRCPAKANDIPGELPSSFMSMRLLLQMYMMLQV